VRLVAAKFRELLLGTACQSGIGPAALLGNSHLRDCRLTVHSLDRNLGQYLHAPDPERVVATLSGGEKRRVALCRALLARPDFLILDEPTNHLDTGSIEWLEDFLARAPRNVTVVVDEAYTDYLPPELRYDSVAWLKKFPNFVLTRTFSKVYGLAGLRVGFGLMHPGIAELLNRVRQPFNVNSLALAAAVAALGDRKFVAKSTRMNRAGMARLERAFKTLGLEFIPSCGNFVTFRVSRARAVYEKLLRQGVIVRPLANYDMPDHLRVTVGTPRENEKFLKALRTALDD